MATAKSQGKRPEYPPCYELRREMKAANQLQKPSPKPGAVMEQQALQDAWQNLSQQFEAVSKLKDSYKAKALSLEKEVALLKAKVASLESELDSAVAKTAISTGSCPRSASERSSDRTAALASEITQLTAEITWLQAQWESMEANYRAQIQDLLRSLDVQGDGKQQTPPSKSPGRQPSAERDNRERLRTLQAAVEKERSTNQRYIDQLAQLSQNREDVWTRLRKAEETVVELNHEIQKLQDQLKVTEAKLKHATSSYTTLVDGNRDSAATIEAQRKKREQYQKLYEQYKEKTEAELLQKDTKIAELEKMITHLQCQMAPPPKKKCCRSSKKPTDGVTMNALKKALEDERTKHVQLAGKIRRLQQLLAESRSLSRSRSRSKKTKTRRASSAKSTSTARSGN